MAELGADRRREMMTDVADRHPAGVQRHDHRVEPVETARALGHQHRRERPVAVPRDRQLDVADLARHRLGERAVTRVREQRRVRIATVIADMVAQLGVQAPLQRRLQHPLQQAGVTRQRLTRIDPGEDLIERARLLQRVRDLLLLPATLLALRISRQGGMDQRHRLVSDVGVARRVTQIDALLDQLP